MNRLIFLALLFLLALLLVVATKAQPSPTAPVNVTLAWDPSAGTNVIANYAVWWGVASRVYTNHISVLLATNATVLNLPRGSTYFFAATATDKNSLTSDYSTEVSTNLPAPPNPVSNLRITSAVGVVP